MKAMMDTIKYLFIIILCAGLVGGAATAVSAQTGDRVVAATGKKQLRQSDINKLIEFYEWVFEAKFTGEQRERFQEYTAEEFRNDPAGSRHTIDDIKTTLPQILAADAGVQAETRKNFLAAFLPEARKNTDENSQMLLSIYDNAHEGGNQSNVASNASNEEESVETEDTSNGSVGNVSALAGTWVWGRSGSYTTTTAGAYLGGNGSRHTYQFSANGAVEYTGIMNMMTAGCRMQIFRTMKGRASLNGDTLTIKWSPAAFSRDDSCSPSKNYKKTMPAETETFKVAFKDSYGQKQLCLTGKDETCYSPEN
jgi:hypothetical protein